jgi:Lipocalin-like domain
LDQDADLYGTWGLKSFHALTADGSKVFPLGEDLSGRIMLDGGGRMAVQIMRRDRKSFATQDPFAMTPDEAKAALLGYIAYYGTLVVDAEAGTVTTTVEVASIPNWVGSEQVRMYQLEGDRLTLSTPPMQVGGAEVTNVLEWFRES